MKGVLLLPLLPSVDFVLHDLQKIFFVPIITFIMVIKLKYILQMDLL